MELSHPPSPLYLRNFVICIVELSYHLVSINLYHYPFFASYYSYRLPFFCCVSLFVQRSMNFGHCFFGLMFLRWFTAPWSSVFTFLALLVFCFSFVLCFLSRFCLRQPASIVTVRCGVSVTSPRGFCLEARTRVADHASVRSLAKALITHRTQLSPWSHTLSKAFSTRARTRKYERKQPQGERIRTRERDKNQYFFHFRVTVSLRTDCERRIRQFDMFRNVPNLFVCLFVFCS